MSAGSQNVIVVGAGAAGLAASVALAGAGKRVTLLERKPYVGGRAYSYEHPALDEVVDCQHVLLGCCTNLIELCEQSGIADKIRWYDNQTFLTSDGGSSSIATSSLPAPLHFAPSFLSLSTLGLADKAGIARGLLEFYRGYPANDDENVENWLRRTGQTDTAIRHFWRPIILATLNDVPAHCSTKYAGKVFHELFVKSSSGGRLGIPTVPLSELYMGPARLFESLGGRLELRASVESMTQLDHGGWQVHTSTGSETAAYIADAVVLALPFEQTQRLLPKIKPLYGAAAEFNTTLDRFVHAPFTSILLWYDRQICDLDHAWLLDTTIEWFFHKSRIRGYAPERGSYVEVVIAGSKAQLGMTREQILTPALRELERFFPDVKRATLLKSGILKEARATFSVTTGLDAFRPQQTSPWPGIYLAGDWTATEWPSTMEGAVRSGRLAAGALLGERERFLVRDLPPSGLMRWLVH